MNRKSKKEIIEILKRGDIAVLPSDTIYGIMCSAHNKESVRRLYNLKRRGKDKAMLVTISDPLDIEKFDIPLDSRTKAILDMLWPGPVSIALPCSSPRYSHMYSPFESIAFRMPADEAFLSLLQETGPLCAPSANPESFPPAETLEMAHNYFGDTIEGYLDGGFRTGNPSTLIKIKDGELAILREGAVSEETIRELLRDL